MPLYEIFLFVLLLCYFDRANYNAILHEASCSCATSYTWAWDYERHRPPSIASYHSSSVFMAIPSSILIPLLRTRTVGFFVV